jgi:Rrf2 family transcriptional regulator, cysteine metabolism repressor
VILNCRTMPINLSRTVLYAIKATTELVRAEPDNPISAAVLAKHGEMPPRFLLQILGTLVSRGILRSTRGVEGGYCINRRPEEITLLDIIESFEQEPAAVAQSELPAIIPFASERLSGVLQRSFDAARHELGQVTMADLISDMRCSPAGIVVQPERGHRSN